MYDKQSALNQLDELYNDGYRIWATDVDTNTVWDIAQFPGAMDIMKSCLQKAKQLGMDTMLRLNSFLNSSFTDFVRLYAQDFDYFLVLSEIQRFWTEGYTVNDTATKFREWYNLIAQYKPNPFVLASFTAPAVVENPVNVSLFIKNVNPLVAAYGLSVYQHNAPSEISLPPSIATLNVMTGSKPIWITEFGSNDGAWLVSQLDTFRNNGISHAIIWEWETFWGDTSFNMRNTIKETRVSAWITNQGL